MSSNDGLFTWLEGIKKDLDGGDSHALAVKFVEGMHERGLVYHWEDDAADCLSGLVDRWEADIINDIVNALFNQGEGEYMFELALDLHNNEDKQLAAMKQLLTQFSPGSDSYAEIKLAIDKRKLEIEQKETSELIFAGVGNMLQAMVDDDGSRFCTCDIKDLATWGCKCGGC